MKYILFILLSHPANTDRAPYLKSYRGNVSELLGGSNMTSPLIQQAFGSDDSKDDVDEDEEVEADTKKNNNATQSEVSCDDK